MYRRVRKEDEFIVYLAFGHSLWSANQLLAQEVKKKKERKEKKPQKPFDFATNEGRRKTRNKDRHHQDSIFQLACSAHRITARKQYGWVIGFTARN